MMCSSFHSPHSDNDEVTPLIQAAMDGNEIIIKFLLAYVSITISV